MNWLAQKVQKEAFIVEPSIIKVDAFLNHQLEITFFKQLQETFYELFKDSAIDKIVTCEASGIAVGLMCGLALNKDVVFAKKSLSAVCDATYYHSKVFSYTKQQATHFIIDKRFIKPQERILLVDDFLANGEAMKGLIHLVEQAQAVVAGIGVVIEKGFQKGGAWLRAHGYPLQSLLIVDAIKDQTLIFRNDLEVE